MKTRPDKCKKIKLNNNKKYFHMGEKLSYDLRSTELKYKNGKKYIVMERRRNEKKMK